MTIVKANEFNENATVNLIMEKIPTAKMVSNVGAEMEFVLEHESSKYFKDLFFHLESK